MEKPASIASLRKSVPLLACPAVLNHQPIPYFVQAVATGAAVAGLNGKLNATQVPRFSSLVSSTLPPCSAAMLLTIARPSPTPPELAERERSTR